MTTSPPPLRAHIITEEDPFYIPVFFAEFFRRIPRDQVVVTGVDITPPLNQTRALGLARKLYGLYGPVDFLRLALRYAGAKLRDRLLPESSWQGTVPRIARRHGIETRVVPNVNAPEYVAHVRALAPDLLISVAASQIIRRELLCVPRLDAINIHTGTLPRYRGMLPVFWQLHDRRPEIGITIHTMTDLVDVGDVLLHKTVPVDPRWSLDGAIRAMKREGANALLELLERYRTDAVTRTPMDRSTEEYHRFPGRAAANAFRAMGLRLL